MRFSIITPYYKCFNLMRDYFNCLEKQTFRDFEVVVVDDASNDEKAVEISKQLTELEIKNKVISNEKNYGPGVARNIGIQHATGDYIFFLDADDWIASNTMEMIDNLIKENPRLECIAFDYKSVNVSGDETVHSILNSNNEPDLIKNINTSSCGKVYKKKFIAENKLEFYPAYLAEDFYFTISAISLCKEFYHIKEPFYYYKQNSTSIVHNIKDEMIDKIKLIIDELYDREYITIAEKDYFVLREYIYTLIIQRMGKKDEYIVDLLNNYPNKQFKQNLKNLKAHQRVIISLYKMKVYKLVEIGLKICS